MDFNVTHCDDGESAKDEAITRYWCGAGYLIYLIYLIKMLQI